MRRQSRRVKRIFKPVRKGIRNGAVPRWSGSLKARRFAKPNPWRPKDKVRRRKKIFRYNTKT